MSLKFFAKITKIVIHALQQNSDNERYLRKASKLHVVILELLRLHQID